MTDEKPSKKAKSADFRGRLAQELIESQEKAIQVLRDAMDATGQEWVTITCKHCSRQGRYHADVPAHKERLAALQMWSDQGFGKAAQAAKPEDAAPPTDIRYEDLPTDEAKAEYRQRLIKLASPALISTLTNP